MSAVEVPAELIELCVDTIEALAKMVPALDLAWQQEVARMGRQLRALLPQPAPTCPNCGRADNMHRTGSWQPLGGDPTCPIPAAALPTVRALLDAERDSKPTPAKPRTWKTGDPEPEGVERVRDSDDDDDRSNGDIWIKRPSGKWRLEKNILAGDGDLDFHNQPKGMQWAHLLNEYGPLTEVIADGAR